jgi:hypothetical protein
MLRGQHSNAAAFECIKLFAERPGSAKNCNRCAIYKSSAEYMGFSAENSRKLNTTALVCAVKQS